MILSIPSQPVYPADVTEQLRLDTARYIAALLIMVVLPPSVLYWFIIHPFIRFWRRLGTKTTFLVVLPLLGLMSYGIVLLRRPLMSVEFGTNYFLWPLAVLCYGIAIKSELQVRRHLKFRSSIGVPELAGNGKEGILITEGIYGRLRHPRYRSLFLVMLAWAFFANYLAIYLMVPVIVLALYLVTLLEEKELRRRFGEVYVEYCRRTPRFIPGNLRWTKNIDWT